MNDAIPQWTEHLPPVIPMVEEKVEDKPSKKESKDG